MSLVSGLQNIKNNKPIDPWMLKHSLSQAIIGTQNDPKEKTKTSFAPSQVGYLHGTCPRYWYLAFDGVTFINKNTASSINNMRNGTLAHERLQKAFEDAEDIESVEAEHELEVEDPPIYGFVDLIITYHGIKYVGEIKTAKSQSYYSIVKDGKIPLYHLVQLLLYMKFLDIHQGFFLYENKDNLDFTIIPISYSDYADRVDSLVEWMKKVRLNWELEEETLPKRPWTKSKGGCKFCPLKKDCYDNNPEGTVKISPLEF